jgi:SAM-dependent methyltransferase
MNTSNPGSSYDPAYFEPLFASEERHFWFRGRNEIIAAAVADLTRKLDRGYRVLEVGCGTGNVLSRLEQECADGLVAGMDLFAEGLYYAQKRVSCGLVQGDLHSPPFQVRFDLVCLFDVLEHMEDDVAVLHALREILSPQGRLVLTVPAHQSLWSYFDEASHHYRRYSVEVLIQCLVEAGYRVEYITEYMASLFPLVWLGRKIATFTNSRGEENLRESTTYALATRELRIVPVLNEVLFWLLKQEVRWIGQRRRLSVGTSIIAIAYDREV